MIDFSFDELEQNISVSNDITKVLRDFWPSKFKLINAYDLKELIQAGNSLAKEYGFTSNVNNAYYIMLMFLLGYRFDKDLKYPWLVSVLNDDTISNESYKASSLQFMLKTHLETLMIPVGQ